MMSCLFEEARKKNFDFANLWKEKAEPHLKDSSLNMKKIESLQIITASLYWLVYGTLNGLPVGFYDSLLPPCAAIIHVLQDKFEPQLEISLQKMKFHKQSDLYETFLNFPLTDCVLSNTEIFIVETEILLQKCGYRAWLAKKQLKHSIHLLRHFYLNEHGDDINTLYFYMAPHHCRPWNTVFGLALVHLMYPDQKMDYVVIDDEIKVQHNFHATVINKATGEYFDLLAFLGL